MLSLASGLIVLLGVVSFGFSTEPSVDYLAQVKPLLKARCYSCHGAVKQKAGLRLDTVELILKGGESGSIVDRDPTKASELIARVSGRGGDVSVRIAPRARRRTTLCKSN